MALGHGLGGVVGGAALVDGIGFGKAALALRARVAAATSAVPLAAPPKAQTQV